MGLWQQQQDLVRERREAGRRAVEAEAARRRNAFANPQRPAPQDAQDAPGGQDGQQAPRGAAPFDLPPSVQERAQDARDRQAARLGGMISHVEQAFRDENDSRVAQAREAKRMDFARDIERMRQEHLLQRLAMTQDDSPRRYAPPAPWAARRLNQDGTWDYIQPDENGNIAFGG